MIDGRVLPAVLALIVAASPAFAAAPPLSCDPKLGPATTLADLEATYGKANVVTGEVDGPEGTSMIATTIFPKDEAKTFQVYWFDEEKHERLAGYTIPAGSEGPGGIKVGSSIKDVQKINGKPFTLSGFYWDYGGSANFDGGKLGALSGDCYLSITFAPSIDPPNDTISNAISGEQDLRSDMKEFDVVKPVVQSIDIGYADPEAPADDGSDGDDAAE